MTERMRDVRVDDQVIHVLDSIFDRIPVSIILIDHEGIILMISQSFASFLGVSKEEALGKKVEEINRNTRFPYVLKSKEPEIAWKHTFQNGETAIVHRMPILNAKGETAFGFGMVLFDNMEALKKVIETNELLMNELSHYKKMLKSIQGAQYSWKNIIGSSPQIMVAKELGMKASATDSTVLITGESGTGKELFAHAIHNGSLRQDFPFVKINCGAIPYELLESELFGYEEGAFTGSKKGGKAGKFEVANGGSIFLDEIGEMPKNMQVKLLRVLQEREIERLGSVRSMKIDVRMIAATNQNLEALVEQNVFREDLYYRLNVMSLEAPPLRKRMADIQELATHLIAKIALRLGKFTTDISEDALQVLRRHQWPGNVRELENVLERAINLCEGSCIEVSHVPPYLRDLETSEIMPAPQTLCMKTVVGNVEKELIQQALKQTNGNKAGAATLLGIARSCLYDKIKAYGINDSSNGTAISCKEQT